MRDLVLAACLLSMIAGCTSGRMAPTHDGGRGTDAAIIPGCDSSRDADADGIADLAEGASDQDGDGIPNDHDQDSDGDGILDTDEHLASGPCTRPDTDADGLPNWLDTDSDNDGLPDADEVAIGTDPHDRDTDGDGVTDLGEVRGTMTDPTNAASTVPPEDFFVVLPYFGDRVPRTLQFGTEIHQADVYFLIDTTGSMGGPISNVQSSLTRIAADLAAAITDVQMGVGEHRDFPNAASPFDPSGYGSPGDSVYANHQDITPDIAAVQTALNGLGAGGGADGPESQVESLYQTATGEGGSWTFSSGAPPYSIARRRCVAFPDEVGTRRGYPCFRPGSLPIVVLVSDIEFHNGSTGANTYAGISPPPHTFAQAAGALSAIGARFIGVAVNGGGRSDQEAMARMTGSVDTTGRPLVYDAAGGTVSDAIVMGITALVGGTPQDVTTTTEDVPGNPDGVDARLFIKAVTPVEGYAPDGTAGPNPGVSYASRDDTTFYAVVPGTRVDFAVDFWNDFVPPPPTSQIYRAVIVVVGNGVARLDTRRVYIIVPPEGATVLL